MWRILIKKFLVALIAKNPRLIEFNICTENNDISIENPKYGLKSLKKNINSLCSENKLKDFCINLSFYSESQAHNTCLNRKLCIDADGNIKNCPNMPQTYGNIKDTTLSQSIEKQGFKDCWYICKDKIDVCKDCEFRHICTDCRAFIKDPQNIYSQPAKCGYNPYICLWQGQDGYVPVEECGTYSKESGFVPDAEKIEKLNAEIWENNKLCIFQKNILPLRRKNYKNK